MGNHDRYSSKFYSTYFERIRSWQMFGTGKTRIVFTHYPLTPESFAPNSSWINVHGHVHMNSVQHRKDNYFNLCPEVAGYRPISVEALLTEANQRHAKGLI